jgi:hypothetical protein
MSASLIHLLHNHEHLSILAAELLESIAKEHDSGALVVGDVLREIGRMGAKEVAQDTSGVRNIAAFVGELAERLPALVLQNLR